MIRDLKPVVARVRIFDEARDIVGHITDYGTGERDHADDDDDYAGDRDYRILRAYVLNDISDAAGIEDHVDRVVRGLQETQVFCARKRHAADDKRGQKDKKNIEEQYRQQYDLPRILS